MKKSYILIAAVAAVSLGAAGCGNGDESPKTFEKDQAEEKWSGMSSSQQSDICSGFKIMGREMAVTLVKGDVGDEVSDSEIEEFADFLQEKCK